MKVDLDMSEIFTDEDGNSFHPDFKRQILDAVSAKVMGMVKSELTAQITKEVKEAVNAFLEKEIPLIMDAPFVPTSSYGSTKPETTLRNVIRDHFQTECKITSERYASDNNEFTKQLKQIVATQMKSFSNEYCKLIDAAFVKEALDFAQKKLQEKLGVA